MLGGLARRATVIREIQEEVEGERPVLVVDTGDTLHSSLLVESESAQGARKRAYGILDALGRMGYAAMSLGPRDLVGGHGNLVSASQDAGVRLLGANLHVSPRRRPFHSYEIMDLDGLRVGLVGLSTAEHCVQVSAAFRAAGVTASDPVEAASGSLKELEGKTDLVIILGNLRDDEIEGLAEDVEGAHLLLTGGRGPLILGEERGDMLRYEPGSRGQLLIRLDVALRGEGRLVDRRSRRDPRVSGAGGVVSSRPIILEEHVAEDPSIVSLIEGLGPNDD